MPMTRVASMQRACFPSFPASFFTMFLLFHVLYELQRTCGRPWRPARVRPFKTKVSVSWKKSLVGLKRTWDQKLSSSLMLVPFMTVHLLQFRFTITEQYWHPSWLITLTLFRTGNKHVPVWCGFACLGWEKLS